MPRRPRCVPATASAARSSELADAKAAVREAAAEREVAVRAVAEARSVALDVELKGHDITFIRAAMACRARLGALFAAIHERLAEVNRLDWSLRSSRDTAMD